MAGPPRFSRCVEVLRIAIPSAVAVVGALIARQQSLALDDKASPPAAKLAPHQPQKPKPRISISKKTTHLVEPLDRDGYVDYVAALNQKASQGVTPENNAGVLLVRAFGANELQPTDRERFYKLLGIEPLREPGAYLVDFAEFAKDRLGRALTKKELDDFFRSMHEPWSSADWPLLADWVKANQQPLALVIEATRRPRCYLPFVAPAGAGMSGMPFPCLGGSRDAARLLAIRAMLEISRGNITSAEDDLLGCHRLARLYGRPPFLIPALVAYMIDATACAGDARLMDAAQLYAKRALAYQQELRQLAPLPTMADVIEQEQLLFLDTVTRVAREELPPGEAFGLLAAYFPNEIEKAFAHRSAINWDDALIFGNEQFDKAVAAFRKPTGQERKRASAQMNQELRKLTPEFDKAFGKWLEGAAARKDLGRTMGKVLTVMLLPAVDSALEAESRAHTRESLGQLGFALAAYHADSGSYPNGLSALAPKYINRVPNDLYTEQPLHYRREGAGCLLYSVGANGVDDGGRTFDSQPPGDDIVLRLSGGPRPRH